MALEHAAAVRGPVCFEILLGEPEAPAIISRRQPFARKRLCKALLGPKPMHVEEAVACVVPANFDPCFLDANSIIDRESDHLALVSSYFPVDDVVQALQVGAPSLDLQVLIYVR